MPLIASADGLLYQEQGRTWPLRALLAGVGVVAIAASAIFVQLWLQMGQLDTPGKLGGAAASLLGLSAFVAFGGYCLYLGLWVPQQTVRLLHAPRLLHYQGRAPLRHWQVSYAFADIQRVQVIEQRNEDGSSSWRVVLQLRAAPDIDMPAFTSEAEAVSASQQIQQLVGLV